MQSSSNSSNKQSASLFKFELKSVRHRTTPPFILGYNSFKTKLDVLPKDIPQILVPLPAMGHS
jgi:hypothetical protein